MPAPPVVKGLQPFCRTELATALPIPQLGSPLRTLHELPVRSHFPRPLRLAGQYGSKVQLLEQLDAFVCQGISKNAILQGPERVDG